MNTTEELLEVIEDSKVLDLTTKAPPKRIGFGTHRAFVKARKHGVPVELPSIIGVVFVAPFSECSEVYEEMRRNYREEHDLDDDSKIPGIETERMMRDAMFQRVVKGWEIREDPDDPESAWAPFDRDAYDDLMEDPKCFGAIFAHSLSYDKQREEYLGSIEKNS